MSIYMYLYNTHSEGGLALKEALGIQQILHRNSSFTGGINQVVINWGSGVLPRWNTGTHVINSEDAVNRSINKLDFFRAIDGKVNHVPWTTDPVIAMRWLLNGDKIVCRTRLEGREGQGIEIISPRGG